MLLLFILSVQNANAIQITDSTNGQYNVRSDAAGTTATSVELTNNSMRTFSVASRLPVGFIIAWPSKSTLANSLTLGEGSSSVGANIQWLECNGATIPDSLTDLKKALGSNKLPDLNRRFLRGTTSEAGKVGQYKDESIKDYEISVPEHSHEFEGEITDQLALGTAYGQNYSFTMGDSAFKISTIDKTLEFTKFNTNYTKPSFSTSSGGKLSGGTYFGASKTATDGGWAQLPGGETGFDANGNPDNTTRVRIGIVRNTPVGSQTAGDNFNLGGEDNGPTAKGDVPELHFIGGVSDSTGTGTVTAHFKDSNNVPLVELEASTVPDKTKIATEEEIKKYITDGMYGYHINKGKEDDDELALLDKYDGAGKDASDLADSKDSTKTETAPIHMYVRYYIRVR